MNLPPLTQRFVMHFGEMGSRWGINRTVGQIYALLYVSAKPLNADDVGEALGFSRSNVSMGLKELQSWNLVRLLHLPNDRREYFQAPEDVWAIFRTLAAERRKREIDPTLSMLRDALMEQPGVAEDIHAQARMKQMHEFIERMTDWLDDVQKMDSATLASLMTMGAKVQKLLEMKDWVKGVFSSTPEPQQPLAAPTPLPLSESVTPTTEVNHGKL
jgi:DNA-binding transcriptional regulator GbsR (MarR family)